MNVSMKFVAFFSECADDEKCLYYTFSTTWGQQVGRFCANEAEHRNGIEKKRFYFLNENCLFYAKYAVGGFFDH